MSRVTNKRIAEAFRSAVPRLKKSENGIGSRFICFALPFDRAGDEAARIVTKRLAVYEGTGDRQRLIGCSTVYDWLLEMGVPKKALTSNRVQKHRHAWLQLLIKEFENKKG